MQGCPRVGSIGFLAVGWFGSVGFFVCPGLLCGVYDLGGVGSVGSVSGSIRSGFGARSGAGQPCNDLACNMLGGLFGPLKGLIGGLSLFKWGSRRFFVEIASGKLIENCPKNRLSTSNRTP